MYLMTTIEGRKYVFSLPSYEKTILLPLSVKKDDLASLLCLYILTTHCYKVKKANQTQCVLGEVILEI